MDGEGPIADCMGRVAFIFPGQGSQYVGMARDFYESDADSRSFMERADEILGISLSRLCFDGPEDELRRTENTQPAIFLHSIVAARRISGIKPEMVAGHSLGEYSALVIAGAIDFDEALRLVRRRGELMQQASEERKGTMAAIVGLLPEAVEEICDEVAEIVQPANLNSPGQIVISGSVNGVRKAMEIARSRGAKLVKELVVSGAFHSPLMESAGAGLKESLDWASIRNATIPVYMNVSARPVTDAAEIREMLHRQLTSAVRWEQTIRNMVQDNATRFYEVGPGKVLQGLVKRTESAVQVNGVDKFSDVPAEEAS